MAIKGLQRSIWFQDSRERGFKEIEDVQKELHISQVTVSIIQAINRIRCRRGYRQNWELPEKQCLFNAASWTGW